MKSAAMLLVGFCAVAASNAQAVDTSGGSLQSTVAHNSSAQLQGFKNCQPLAYALRTWWYNTWSNGPYECSQVNDYPWSMLNAYRSGGTQGVHWKYTNNPNDGECLSNWDYYASDGNRLIITVSGRTTFQGDSRRWCALPVYRSGGVKGKQWAYCHCDDYIPPGNGGGGGGGPTPIQG